MLPPLHRCSGWAYSSLILTQPCQPSPEGVAGSACTSTFSRHARRSLALRPAHSRGHHFVTRYPKASDISSPPCLLRLLPAGAHRRGGLAPTGKRRLVTAHPHRGRRVALLRHRHEGGTARIEDLDNLGKIGERAGQPVDLVDNDGVDPPRREVSQQLLQSRPSQR